MMQTPQSAFHIAKTWLDEGRGVAIATVVKTWGSAPRRVGAQMVVDDAGNMMGSVSGGCVEGAVLHAAMDAIASGNSALLTFGVADESAFEAGLACGGDIHILVQPIGASYGFTPAALREIIRAIEARSPILSITSLDSFSHELRETLPDAPTQSHCDDQQFVHLIAPPLRMIIIGAVHIAQSLTRFANESGFAPIVIDPRAQFLTEARFPDCERMHAYPEDVIARIGIDAHSAVIALAHDPKIDDGALAAALRSDAFYIGALGSRRTHEKRIARLRALGFNAQSIARIHAPIGLDIGAANPAEIAMATMAEIIGVLRGKPIARR